MWSPRLETKMPIEKIRKAQWTAENTQLTKMVVAELVATKALVVSLHGRDGLPQVQRVIDRAIERLGQLDKGAKVER